MKITAAVVRERSGAFNIEPLDLSDPRDDELLVEVVASGMCQTDLHGRDGYYATPYPAVFGHEGAGIVRAIGRGVTAFKPGDHVVMSYPWCGECPNCRSARQSYCMGAFPLKMNGTRADGSTLHAQDGKPVYSAFFQQSSFGNFTIANERYAVKVRGDAPLEFLGPLACGGQTGAGAVLNVMNPKPGDSFVVFGVGAVGLSGLMAAKIAGCEPIIAVDVHDMRLALARAFGATHTINHTGRTDVVAEIRKITGLGARFTLETSALAPVLPRGGRRFDAGRHLCAAGQRPRRHRSDLRDAIPAERPHRPRCDPGRQRAAGVHPAIGRSHDGRPLPGRAHGDVLRPRRHQPRRGGIEQRYDDQAGDPDAALTRARPVKPRSTRSNRRRAPNQP
ncbi:MAG TPA: NAD(P)-dependent alcohol dehydrogenase [Pseudolabrys sp.]